MADDLIGITEAAEIVARDRTMVHRYIREHRLPVALKLPGQTGAYLLRRADVEALRDELDGTNEPAA